MAITTKPTTLHWPKPQNIDLGAIRQSYDQELDLLVLSFTLEPLPRVEVALEQLGGLTPLASVRLEGRNRITDDVIGVMVENLSDGFSEHPEWRILVENRIDRVTLTSLIETFARLSEDSGYREPPVSDL